MYTNTLTISPSAPIENQPTDSVGVFSPLERDGRDYSCSADKSSPGNRTKLIPSIVEIFSLFITSRETK